MIFPRVERSTSTLMVSALALSRIVDGLIAVTAAVAVLDHTGSASWVAGVAAARMIPMAVLGVLVVAAVQVADQRVVLAASAVLRSLSAVALAVLVHARHIHPVWFVVAVGLAGLGAAPFRAGAGRLIAVQTPEGRLIGASSAFNRVDYGSVLVAPGLCGALLIATSLTTTFAITAGLTVVLALSCALVPADRGSRPTPGRALRQVASAARLVLAVREVRTFLAIRAGARVALGIIGVTIALLPARAGVPNLHIAFLQAALGVGAMIIALAPGRLPDRGGLPILLVSTVALTASLVALGAARPLVIASAILAVIGAADLAVHLASSGSLQRSLPRTATAAGSGVADSLVAAGMLAGTLVSPVLINQWGIAASCDVAAGVVLASAILLLPGLRRADAILERRRRTAAPVLEQLQQCRSLQGLSQAHLELLAESAAPVVVRRGGLAIAEGARSDAVFVVIVGEVAVHVSGEDAHHTGRLTTLGVGELFGEIGVLRNRTRTASIVAVEATELLRIPAEPFIAAVTADLGSTTGVFTEMTERLQRSHH